MNNSHKYKNSINTSLICDQQISEEFFSRSFDMKISKSLSDKIKTSKLNYRYLEKSEFDDHILSCINYYFDYVVPSGPKRQNDWEMGWFENYIDCKKNEISFETLCPHYYKRGHSIMRYNDEFIVPEAHDFEIKMLKIILHCVIEKFFDDHDKIYEFGAGPCHNIFTFADFSKNKRFIALDWAESSQQILNLIENNKKSLNLDTHKFEGAKFDFFNPDKNQIIEDKSLVFTFGALEQLGTDYKKILQYFLNQNNVTFVHIEPFQELYSRNNLVSELGFRYSMKRNYLSGYLDSLKDLQNKNIISLNTPVKILGSAYHDGWSFCTWKKMKDKTVDL